MMVTEAPMVFPVTILAWMIALVLAVLAVPFALVQLDLLDAERLRLVPSAIALILAGGAATAIIAGRRARKRRRDR